MKVEQAIWRASIVLYPENGDQEQTYRTLLFCKDGLVCKRFVVLANAIWDSAWACSYDTKRVARDLRGNPARHFIIPGTHVIERFEELPANLNTMVRRVREYQQHR